MNIIHGHINEQSLPKGDGGIFELLQHSGTSLFYCVIYLYPSNVFGAKSLTFSFT